ncbi:hypothetical protein [Novosphingobium sp. CECT 9465]|uniref:hypothetical protein n=1 Tax=Novosphingobium sp. CECT 9465 TaxID=2829794 RepID=UPI001E63404D|nr:hypothetical protein [Novosphingobium sp. CECT 9465]CAH0496407.1 hypothetical protein NVSP9465_01441 [Novosphingobium sp. CECT 9465]
MTHSISTVEVSKSFGRFSRQILEAPLAVTQHDHVSLVHISHAGYRRLQNRDREIITFRDVTHDDRAAAAHASSEVSKFDDETRGN